MAADVVFQETNAVLNSFWGGQEENKVTPRRGHYQQYGPQTRILLKDFFICQWFYNAPRKTVMGWNVECVAFFFFVLNERWLSFFSESENGQSAPSSTRA